MNINEYKTEARKTAIYLTDRRNSVIYPLLGLIGETGEIAGKIKKMMRDDHHVMSEKYVDDIRAEIGDCAWYVANLCDDLGISMTMKSTPGHVWPSNGVTPSCVERLTEILVSIQIYIACLAQRIHANPNNDTDRKKAMQNFADTILVCLCEIARLHNMEFGDVLDYNIEKLKSRQSRGTLRGSGDER